MELQDLAAALLATSLEDLYENAPCGYLVTVPDGQIVKVNRTFLTWTNYQRQVLLEGMRLQDVLTLPGRIFYETHCTPLLHMQGFVQEVAIDLKGSDGIILPVFLNAVQDCDASGTPVLHRITLFDARERRAYERELKASRDRAEQAIQLRDQFLSLAAHELRTPLTSLLGNVQLLQRRANRENNMSTRDLRSIQIIADQSIRLNKMIESLLDVSRIETGQLAIERKPVDLCTLIPRLIDEVQATLDERQIEMRCQLQSAIVQGDELRLEQVFQNLIQNALKYSASTTPVTVVIQQLGAHVAVEVHDQGIGIPSGALSQLFTRFYRASNAQEGHTSGMGIGLYVVKEIVELHNGRITVESAENQGSTFTVSFPIATDLVS